MGSCSFPTLVLQLYSNTKPDKAVRILTLAQAQTLGVRPPQQQKLVLSSTFVRTPLACCRCLFMCAAVGFFDSRAGRVAESESGCLCV